MKFKSLLTHLAVFTVASLSLASTNQPSRQMWQRGFSKSILCTSTVTVERITLPFPEAEQETPDAEVIRLVTIQANERKGIETFEASLDAKKRIMEMGTNAVISLIILLKQAANKDPRVLHPDKFDDYGYEIRISLCDLRDIGDRRAIPVFSTLVKYDDPKSRIILHALAVMLCHGTDEQILQDSQSDNPNVAQAAQMVVRNAMTFEPSKQKFREKRKP